MLCAPLRISSQSTRLKAARHSIFTLKLRNMATYKTTDSKLGPLGTAIQHDHKEMYEFYDYYVKSAGDADKQGRWARQLTWEVARHAVGEEIVVYPLMEEHLGAEGKRLADEDREQHQIVKENLYKLESLQSGTPEYEKTIKAIMEHLKPHNDSEEINDLPMLEAKISEEKAKEAALAFKRTKKFVPTRAHPSVPNHPPLETLVGFIEAPIDKLKDLFASFPTEEMKEEMKNAS